MECKIRHDNANYKMPIEYEKDPGLFSLKIYHAGKFKYVDDKRKYVNGLVAYVDWCDIDKFSVHEIHGVMEKLGYVNVVDPIYYNSLIPGKIIDMGLRALGVKQLLMVRKIDGTEEDECDDEDLLICMLDTYLEERGVQEPEYDVNPDDLDVIDTDNFESGTDSDDDGIENVRRKKLKQIKKAKESEEKHLSMLTCNWGLDANNGILQTSICNFGEETKQILGHGEFLECVGDDLGMTKDSISPLSVKDIRFERLSQRYCFEWVGLKFSHSWFQIPFLSYGKYRKLITPLLLEAIDPKGGIEGFEDPSMPFSIMTASLESLTQLLPLSLTCEGEYRSVLGGSGEAVEKKIRRRVCVKIIPLV
ncbi:hypothetical protein Tco_0619559 [Tanacetum coccineum]